MENENLISVVHFCDCHGIEFSFIHSLQDYGLLEIKLVEEQEYFEKEVLLDVESMVRLHHELGVNLEGIDVISNLLQRIKFLQQQLTKMKNHLSFYD